jgi:D-arabinan exo alpha-(1,3)/(1,5)-arabinofuranosidase (non-reducing end)
MSNIKKVNFGTTSLRDVAKLRNFKRRRVSSYDRSGANLDFLIIKPNERVVIFDQEGPGCITHIWSTQMAMGAKFFPRHVIVRIWWDNEEEPSVECPLGDFFGLGHGERINFHTMPLQMSPQKGKGMNCWWPMPFKKHAKIEIENDNPTSWTIDPDHIPKKLPGMNFYYYVDYEIYDEWLDESSEKIGYFHCYFNRVKYKDMKIDPDTGKKYSMIGWQVGAGHNTRKNGGYDRNHVILEAKGKGQYVGCHIDIDNRWRWRPNLIPGFNWPGEGDDMIFIDDDIGGEPTLYGTGTEDYVNTAYCPTEKYDGLYHGVIKGGWNPSGKYSVYRYHIQDPISFEKEIKVSIEHGHNNHRGDIWETTAYWYQLEPHTKLPALPSREERMPRANSNNLLKCLFLIAVFLILYFSFR